MKRCEYCDSLNPDDAGVCASCGGASFVWQCVNCGTEFKGSRTCPHCGVTVGQAKKTCPRCKAAYYTLVCPSCGFDPTLQPEKCNVSRPIEDPMEIERELQRRPKDKWVAFFLCLFFGVFGMHKFYEGRIGPGILYLFTFGLFGIGWFIDLIVLLTKPNPYYVCKS